MTRKSLNVAMLDKVEDVITRYPKRHNQAFWRAKLKGKDAELNSAPARECGTSMCTAGWVVELDRGRWAYPASSTHSQLLIARQDEIDEKMDICPWVRGPNNEKLITASDRARRLLGITEAEAHELFINRQTKRGVKSYFKVLRKRYRAV